MSGHQILPNGNIGLYFGLSDDDLVHWTNEWDEPGLNQKARALINAIMFFDGPSVHEQLASGTNPNVRLIDDEQTPSDDTQPREVPQDWASDVDNPPRFRERRHRREWYPIQYAVSICCLGGPKSDTSIAIISDLLKRGAYMTKTFRQPLLLHRRKTVFPGQHQQRSEQEDFAAEQWDGAQYIIPIDLLYAEKYGITEKYGVRSIIHSVFEDGSFMVPFLKNKQIDPNLRDPVGRTLLHSACRNALGADVEVTAAISLTNWKYPDKDYVTAFQTLLRRGADPLAVDYQGQNILHHLLQAKEPDYSGSRVPPRIIDTLSFILSEFKTLINQPDNSGIYPLHVALQRLRRYSPSGAGYHAHANLESVIDQFIVAKAKLDVVDCRGNSALHYLADNSLTQPPTSDDTRRLFSIFLKHGLDVNARNNDGRSPINILFGNPGGDTLESLYWEIDHMSEAKRLEIAVLERFNRAGAIWSESDPGGGNLFHRLAPLNTENSVWRAEYLAGKGVDPNVKDSNGKTPIDIAQEHGSIRLKWFLEKYITELSTRNEANLEAI